MKVLITGASGVLGKEVSKLFPKALIPTHKEMPVENWDKVEDYFMYNDITTIIHLAAMVSPPRCDANREQAWESNVIGTENLILACKTYIPDVTFINMSTPCVFDGNNEEPKEENHYTNPDNYYGHTKAIAEKIVEKSGLDWTIIRGNFIKREKYPYKKAFTDRFSNYLFADQLAKGIKDVFKTEKNIRSIIHLVGNKVLSMYELAKLCPNSEDILKYTLKEYYKENPNTTKLTQYMILKDTNWRKEYSIYG